MVRFEDSGSTVSIMTIKSYLKLPQPSYAHIMLNSTYAMNITGQIANASVIVNENHTDGQVKFNITAFDLAGNNLTVNQTNLNSSNLTIDKNVPSVTNLSLYSNNSDPSLARAGDLINITLEVSEQIYNATLQIFDTETSMTESNNTAYANITVLQNSPNGLATFNITAYDGAGNEFNITQNDASANVIIDTVDPALSNLTIYSNNANPSLATVNNILSITITANESTVKLFPARSKAVMLNDTSPSSLLRYIHACICHYTTYIHHVCRVQDCNVCSFEGLICSDCDA